MDLIDELISGRHMFTPTPADMLLAQAYIYANTPPAPAASAERVEYELGVWRARISYREALKRCTNPKQKCWPDYGGRGIRFLFTSFEQFLAELGPRPAGTTLDRIDNDGNYQPGNVRWATPAQQRVNQRKRRKKDKQ